MRRFITGSLSALVFCAAFFVTSGSASAQYPVPFGLEAVVDGAIGELFHPAAVAGANTGCRPSAAHPYPVVLVHATLADEADNWVTLSPLLADNGYCVFAFNYGETQLSLGGRIDGLGHIPHSAEELAAFVEKVLAETGAHQVDLVGHSQGGMMPNYYIHFLGGASKVHTFVALAPSNHGTTEDGLVTLLRSFPFASSLEFLLEAIGAPALPEQAEGSPFMVKLFGAGEPLAPSVHYVVIETDHDEVVTPYTNAFLHGPNVTDILLQDQCPTDPVGHIGMFEDYPALQDVLNWLSQVPNPNFQPRCERFGIGI